MKQYISLMVCCILNITGSAHQYIIKVTDASNGLPIYQAQINSNNEPIAITNQYGVAVISDSAKAKNLVILYSNYFKKDTLVLATTDTIRIQLQARLEELEEVTFVSTTRNDVAIENSPQKVEVLGSEELKEEAGIKPGNIASILGDVSGIQIQQTSATTGNSNVRIQGLDGKYTQILRDGMPMYDGFSGGFGILTIPPLDLKQIDLIKGSASTLYGGGAIGGLINLISKRPTMDQELDALVNVTTLKEFNANCYAAKRNNKWGYTMFGGYNRQLAVDVNDDGMSDVPNATTVMLHPKFFWYPDSSTVMYVGTNLAIDNRIGGDMSVLDDNEPTTATYSERNKTLRNTIEYALERRTKGKLRITLKGNYSIFNRVNNTQGIAYEASQNSYYNEASIVAPLMKGNIISGITMVGDAYKTISPKNVNLSTFNNLTYGVFAQYNKQYKKTNIELGIRADKHTTYGNFILPRVAAIHRFNNSIALRAGMGMGYKTPNPLAPQNFEYSPINVNPPAKQVHAETSYGYNLEANYKRELNEDATFFINQAFFYTKINSPLGLYIFSNGMSVANLSTPTKTMGSDSYIKLQIEHWELYIGYTYTQTHTDYSITKNQLVLTPKHRAAFVAVKEWKQWRVGLEGSYTGAQYRYDGTLTPDYFFIAAMVQRNFGKHVMVVLNGENLLDYRMSKVERLFIGSIQNPSFKPLWAPIDGRVINLSLRWRL